MTQLTSSIDETRGKQKRWTWGAFTRGALPPQRNPRLVLCSFLRWSGPVFLDSRPSQYFTGACRAD